MSLNNPVTCHWCSGVPYMKDRWEIRQKSQSNPWRYQHFQGEEKRAILSEFLVPSLGFIKLR